MGRDCDNLSSRFGQGAGGTVNCSAGLASRSMKLQNGSGDTLLTLRNYTNFDTLRVLGPDSTDTFNVYTAASGPSRNLSWTAVCPWAKKKSTDNLNIFYTPPSFTARRPRIRLPASPTWTMARHGSSCSTIDIEHVPPPKALR
jgi:hypothetical protein